VVIGFDGLSDTLKQYLDEQMCSISESLIYRCRDFKEYYDALCWIELLARRTKTSYEAISDDFIGNEEIKRKRILIARLDMKQREESKKMVKNILTKLGES